MTKSELLSKIKPKVDKCSDKYSWQLYQFIKRNGCTKVYYNLKEDELYDCKAPRWNRIYICKELQGDIFGNSLTTIQSPSVDKYSMNCYCESNGYKFIDITNTFWDMYIKDGRCVFDRNHNLWWSGGGDKYTMIDENTKICNWCSKELHRREIVTEKIEEVWE